MRHSNSQRAGVSLLEVLISIGVIALGIFGVASLIPVAQFKVAEGTRLDRQAALGPSAVAEFRIRGMNSPANWIGPTLSAAEVQRGLPSRAVVIDPLGYLAGTTPQQIFPMNSSSTIWQLPRFTLNTMPALPLAQSVFYLQDDLIFDRPSDQAQQPRRQYFIDTATNRPLAAVPESSLTWFATLSPFTAVTNAATDEFLLSVVLCSERVPELAEEFEAQAKGGAFPGDLSINNPSGNSFVSELQIGDWLLVGKLGTATNVPGAMTDPTKKVYRWTRIIGVSEDEDDSLRRFVIANDDWLLPTTSGVGEDAWVFFVKGVESVYERTIRLETSSTAWDN